jgi:hypothetical protein
MPNGREHEAVPLTEVCSGRLPLWMWQKHGGRLDVERGSEIEMTDSDKRKEAVAIGSLSDAQLIYILQRAVDDDEGAELTQFVEAEIARRKIQGGALQ